MSKELIIDAEFKNLIPPLSESELSQLEINIINDGCRDPIVIWNGIIVDGHNRFNICTNNSIEFNTVEKEFDNKNAVKLWMINNQAGRRNLTDGWKFELLQSKKDILLLVGKSKQERKPVDSVLSTIDKTEEEIPHNTRSEIANDLGWSTGKVAMADKVWKEADTEVKDQIKSGETSINQAYKTIKSEENKVARIDKINEISQGNVELDLSETYPVIYADPPWQYDHSKSDSRKIENHYPTMTIDEICDMPVNDLAAKDSILFLWTTSPKLEQGIRVVNAWGFNYITCAIWDKQKKGLGYYFRQNHEILLIGKRGNIPAPDPQNRPDSIVSIPKEKHSAKPHEFYEIIEKMYPSFSKIELFCRSPRDGWRVWGNQSNDT